MLSRVHVVAVANPMKLKSPNDGTAKNDRNDSFKLAYLFAIGGLPTIWLPDEETQQDREILRYRCNLVKEQTRTKNRIRALLAEHGLNCPASDLQSQDARQFLARLTSRLPWAAQEVLACYLEDLKQLGHRLERVNSVIEVRAARRPEIALLMTIRGVDVVLAMTILTAIGPIERFATPGSLSNYAGLVPRQHASAGHNHQGRITKAGSKELRWALTEAAHNLRRMDGPYRNLYRRLVRKKNMGVAMAACARKLLVAVWHMLTRNETFRFAEPDLIERKVQRRARRLAAARRRLASDGNDRQRAITERQVALAQDLARRGKVIPLPKPLQATHGKRFTAADLAATG